MGRARGEPQKAAGQPVPCARGRLLGRFSSLGVSTHPLAHALHRNPPLQLRHESEGSQHLVVDLWLASSLTGVLELDGLGRVKAVHGWAGLVEVTLSGGWSGPL